MAGIKSALELAMEKVGKLEAEAPSTPLTEEQRREISELRKVYDAKIAEKEIMLQAEIRKLMQQRPPHEAAAAVRELQETFQETKRALRQELEEKIAAVRARP